MTAQYTKQMADLLEVDVVRKVLELTNHTTFNVEMAKTFTQLDPSATLLISQAEPKKENTKDPASITKRPEELFPTLLPTLPLDLRQKDRKGKAKKK